MGMLGRYLIKKAIRETRREVKRTSRIAMKPYTKKPRSGS